jgi:cysteine desulfurase
MVKTPIYLDNNATTRCDPRVVEAMLPFFSEHYGNAASRNHPFGWFAEEAVDTARDQVAALFGASGKEIIFTSGATESNNLAIKGVAAMYARKGKHIITQVTEHKAVVDPCKRLERDGYQVTFLPVDKEGRVSPEQVAAAMTDQTILVTLMAATPLMARLFDSVAPLVKMISFPEAPIRAAICSRAFSTASSASQP